MKLINLSVQAFRGIRDRIDIDLSSALTVLYAPNGTGKTSICDAVEWLVTGQIDRLGIGLGAGAEGPRCAFSPKEISVEVSATARINRDQRVIGRDEDGAWAIDALERKRLGESDWLTQIAPGIVSENVHGASANATLRGWLRGSRFLSGDSLALLVDSTNETNDSRQRVFADILGTRPLVDTYRKIDRYRQTLNGYISPAASQESFLRKQIEDLRRQLVTSISEGVATGVLQEIGTAQTKLRELYTAMGESDLRELTMTEPDEAIQVADRILARGSARLTQLRTTLSEVEARWPQRLELASRAEALSSRVSILTSAIVVLQKQTDEASASQLVNEQQMKQLQRDAAQMSSCSSQIRQATTTLTPLVNSVDTLRSAASRSMADLYESVPEYKKSSEELNALRDLAEQLRSTRERWMGIPDEMSRLDTRSRELAAAIAETGDTSQMESQRDRLRSELQGIRSQYESTASAVNKLKQAAAVALQSLEAQNHCPVCNTPFPDAAALKIAIESTLSSMPSAQLYLAKFLTDREAVLQELETRLKRGVCLSQELESVRRRCEEVSQSQRDFVVSFRRLGLSGDRVRIPDIDGVVARLTAAQALKNILAALKSLSIDGSAWGSTYTAFVEMATKQADDSSANLSLQLAEKSKAAAQLKEELEKVANDMEQYSSEKKRIEAQLAVAQTEVQSLKKKWETLAGVGGSWHDTDLSRVKDRIDGWFGLQRQAEAHAAAAKRIRECQIFSKQMDEQSANLTTLQTRLQGVRARLALANGACEVINRKIESHTREQIETLRSVVAPLFSRMQANRFFDTVRTGSSPLDWLGVAAGKVFMPDLNFSQGQRQDLALAIFLARARGLGGTFFLDEPLAHLDDLNRVALLDVLRVMVVENESDLNLLITTANRSLVKHMVQKFARVPTKKNTPVLRVYELSGNARVGVSASESK